MKILQDYFIVTIDQLYETNALKSGIIPVSETWVDPQDENSNQHKRIFGTVITCPESFSDLIYKLEDPGFPPPSIFVGHDSIQSKVNQGYTKNHLPVYNPSTFNYYKFETLHDLSKKVDVKNGDRVYVDHNAISDENNLGEHNGNAMYKIRIDQIYCSVRRIKEDVSWESWIDKIQMQGNWVLVEPDLETWDDITTPSGILIKSAPANKYLIGFVRHISHRVDIKSGDKIIYMHNSDAPLKVEGKDYFVMLQDDILCNL